VQDHDAARLLAHAGTPSPPNGPVAFGTAYFGVRDPDLAAADLAAIAAAGHTWVLLPMTQDDAVWEGSTFRELVSAARSAGLDPIVSPWGGLDFGGEGIAGPLSVAEWLDRAHATGATTLHIDEPKAASTTIGAIIDHWPGTVWLTIEPHRVAVLRPEDADRVAVLGTDAYEGNVAERAAATTHAKAALGRLDLAWVQAFRIRTGEEAEVGAAVVAMAQLAPRVGIWGWKGSTGRGRLRSDRPDVVAAAVRDGIAVASSRRATTTRRLRKTG
jgi:hypothetical protein